MFIQNLGFLFSLFTVHQILPTPTQHWGLTNGLMKVAGEGDGVHMDVLVEEEVVVVMEMEVMVVG